VYLWGVFYFDPLYLVLIGPAMLLALWAQLKVSSAFARWSRVPNALVLTGAQAARSMLDQAGLNDVAIEETSGRLSDHYDPRNRTLYLSSEVYRTPSVAALGVACHEAGHALQHALKYPALGMRNAIVPIANIGSWLAWPMIVLGLALNMAQLSLIGVVAFLGLVAFQAITLPVEFDASRRAKVQLSALGLVQGPEETAGVRQVLSAAALTYVAATITALAQLLYFLIRLGVIGGRRDDR
jgi:Zn-dependent membrane protease YugP